MLCLLSPPLPLPPPLPHRLLQTADSRTARDLPPRRRTPGPPAGLNVLPGAASARAFPANAKVLKALFLRGRGEVSVMFPGACLVQDGEAEPMRGFSASPAPHPYSPAAQPALGRQPHPSPHPTGLDRVEARWAGSWGNSSDDAMRPVPTRWRCAATVLGGSLRPAPPAMGGPQWAGPQRVGGAAPSAAAVSCPSLPLGSSQSPPSLSSSLGLCWSPPSVALAPPAPVSESEERHGAA